ncbi:hypothetical protein GUJ93_ZPchr0001g30368 [Zizania palustris]|uniref:Uncharacterized protein n=1 Tax=Zizania palustris TaxID=103762 RepID=A0A8J5VTY1_ZIZPA|nr:hypothetical protein GUJ93_ZPchr0001g30368 [Zizania palustris]
MDSIEEGRQWQWQRQRQEEEEEEDIVVEVPEMDGELLVELLDASLAAAASEVEAYGDDEAAARRKQQQQVGFFTGDVGDGWDGQELNSVHPHQEEGCQDCGLDDILSVFDGCGPYVVDDPVEFWMEEMDQATAGAFTGEFAEEWYMDGMAMEDWEDGRSFYSFHFPSYGGSDAACSDQLYSSLLWE